MYLGTYTSQAGGGTGIGLATYLKDTGQISSAGVLGGVADPSFLALAASGRTLYAVNEQEQGMVTAIAIDDQGALRVLGARSTGGSAPAHLAVVAEDRFVVSANYNSGNLSVHPVDVGGALGERSDLVQHTGSGPDPRQEGPHAHMVLSDPVGAHLIAVDLGTDTVYTYRLDTRTGTLAAVSQARMRPGAGPRHLAFHPSGQHAFVVNELNSTVTVCAYDSASGTITPGDSYSSVPPGVPGAGQNFPAEVLVSADGRVLYVSNRGHDSIARFAVESGGSALRLVDTVSSGGDFPRHIAMDPAGRLMFAANQRSGSVVSFLVDRHTGALSPSGTLFRAPIPVCVLAT